MIEFGKLIWTKSSRTPLKSVEGGVSKLYQCSPNLSHFDRKTVLTNDNLKLTIILILVEAHIFQYLKYVLFCIDSDWHVFGRK